MYIVYKEIKNLNTIFGVLHTLIKLFCVFNANFAIHYDYISVSSNRGVLDVYDCSIILSFYLKKKSNKILNFGASLTICYFGGITKTQPSVFSLTVFLQQFCTLLYRYRDRSLKPNKRTLCQHVLKYFALFSYFFFYISATLICCLLYYIVMVSVPLIY